MEIKHFDVEVLVVAAAAAAMSIVRLEVEALALEAALERLGGHGEHAERVARGKEMSGKKKRIWRRKVK